MLEHIPPDHRDHVVDSALEKWRERYPTLYALEKRSAFNAWGEIKETMPSRTKTLDDALALADEQGDTACNRGRMKLTNSFPEFETLYLDTLTPILRQTVADWLASNDETQDDHSNQ